jgi:hypothetical protein
MITREYPKSSVLLELLHSELEVVAEDLLDGVGHRGGIVKISLLREPTAEEDIEIRDITLNHTPSSSIAREEEITSLRMKDGFAVYQRIFAHISERRSVTHLDTFLSVYPHIITFRCLLKDGQNESALRFMKTVLEPFGLFPDFDLYRQWVRENAKKYNPALTDQMLDAIEDAPQGAV